MHVLELQSSLEAFLIQNSPLWKIRRDTNHSAPSTCAQLSPGPHGLGPAQRALESGRFSGQSSGSRVPCSWACSAPATQHTGHCAGASQPSEAQVHIPVLLIQVAADEASGPRAAGWIQWPSPCGLPLQAPHPGFISPSLKSCFKRMMNRKALHNSPRARWGQRSVLSGGDPALDWEKWLHLSQLASFLPVYHSAERWHSLLPWGQWVADSDRCFFH